MGDCRRTHLSGVAARDVADELETHAKSLGQRVLYFGAGGRLEKLRGATHARLHIGAQPVWNPQKWNAIVESKASLRAQLHRARNKNVSVVECHPDAVPVKQLRSVLDEWLSFRGLPPLAFLVTPDLFGNLADRRIFVAYQHDEPVAFLVATPIPSRAGWLVEEWPRRRNAPNGTTHLLVDAAMRAFALSGAQYATLGLAPLSVRDGHEGDGEAHWLRLVLAWLRAHGTRFFNFRGLEAFKAGMLPHSWEPIYAISQGKRFPPLALRAIAGAFSAGSPELLVARGIANAALREFKGLLSRDSPEG